MAVFWAFLLLLSLIAVLGARWLALGLPMHMDEYDYLFIGRQLLDNQGWPSLTYVFGADHTWYAYAWLEQQFAGSANAGSYPGPRLLSFVLGLISLAGCYVFSHTLWQSKRVALLATLLLGARASHIFISSITTYDALAFALLAWSVTFLWMLIQSRQRLIAVGSTTNRAPALNLRQVALFTLSLLTLLGAVLTKYIVLLFLPVFFLLSVVTVPLFALAGAVLMSMALISYFVIHQEALLVLYETQINGVHGANVNNKELLLQFLHYVMLQGIVLLAATLAVFARLIYRRFIKHASLNATNESVSSDKVDAQKTLHRFLGFPFIPVIVLLAVVLPLYHLQAQNRIALPKHLGYSAFFLAPLVAYCLQQLYTTIRSLTNTAVVPAALAFAFLVVFGLDNARKLHMLKRAYPDMSDVVALWRDATSNKQYLATDTVLSEDPYLFRYLAISGSDQANIRETTWLDNDGDGNHSAKDVKDALWDRKFDWVLLTDQLHPEQNILHRKILALRGYTRVYSKPYYLSPSLSGNRLGVVELFKSQ